MYWYSAWVIAIATRGGFLGCFRRGKWHSRRIQQTLQAGSRKVAGNLRGKRFNNSLIAVQIALTLLLMTGGRNSHRQLQPPGPNAARL